MEKINEEGVPYVQIACENGISFQLFHWRLKQGMSPELASSLPTGKDAKEERLRYFLENGGEDAVCD